MTRHCSVAQISCSSSEELSLFASEVVITSTAELRKDSTNERLSCRAFKLYIQGGRDAHPTRLEFFLAYNLNVEQLTPPQNK